MPRKRTDAAELARKREAVQRIDEVMRERAAQGERAFANEIERRSRTSRDSNKAVPTPEATTPGATTLAEPDAD